MRASTNAELPDYYFFHMPIPGATHHHCTRIPRERSNARRVHRSVEPAVSLQQEVSHLHAIDFLVEHTPWSSLGCNSCRSLVYTDTHAILVCERHKRRRRFLISRKQYGSDRSQNRFSSSMKVRVPTANRLVFPLSSMSVLLELRGTLNDHSSEHNQFLLGAFDSSIA